MFDEKVLPLMSFCQLLMNADVRFGASRIWSIETAQRAQAVTDRVRAGDAAGAAAELAALSGDALGPIWERLDHDTAEALRAAWPDA